MEFILGGSPLGIVALGEIEADVAGVTIPIMERYYRSMRA